MQVLAVIPAKSLDQQLCVAYTTLPQLYRFHKTKEPYRSQKSRKESNYSLQVGFATAEYDNIECQPTITFPIKPTISHQTGKLEKIPCSSSTRSSHSNCSSHQ